MSLVSIVMPVYNGEEYIEQAISSVLTQTYPHIELIVIDDGSTDATPDIVQRFENVRYVRQLNQGPSAARNLGVRLSSGKYIAMMDADDLSVPTRIEAKVAILDTIPKVDYVFCDVDVINEKNEILYQLRSEYEFNKKEDAVAFMLYRQFIPAPGSIIARRNCFDEVPYPFQYKNAEDYYMMIEWSSRFNSYYLSKALYLYRRHQGNLTNAHQNQLKAEIEIIKSLGLDHIKEIVARSHFSAIDKTLLLAKIMMKIGNYDEAEIILSEIAHKESEVFFLLGICQYQRHLYEDAMCSFESSLGIEHKLAEVWNNMGCTLVQLNQVGKAETCFQKAITIRPEYMDANWNMKAIHSLKNNELRLTIKPLRKVLTFYETISEETII